MRLTLADEMLEPFVAEAQRGKLTVEEVVERQLQRLQGHPLTEGLLILDSAVRGQLEESLGVGSTRSPTTLLAAIARLAQIEVGRTKIVLTTAQLEELKARAEKRGLTFPEMLREHAEAVKESLFTRM